MPHGFISLSFDNNVGGTFTVKKSQRSYGTFSMHLPQSLMVSLPDKLCNDDTVLN